jgi:hypothetical protein
MPIFRITVEQKEIKVSYLCDVGYKLGRILDWKWTRQNALDVAKSLDIENPHIKIEEVQ